MSTDLLTRDLPSGVRILTFNRPERFNALSPDINAGIRAAFDSVEDDGIRCIVFRGEGPRAFSVGADLKVETTHAADAVPDATDMFFPGKDIMPPCRVPVIAAVHGYCCGGGWELALAADICIATEDAEFWFPQTGLGLFPGAGGTGRLVKAVGKTNAMEVILTGRHVNGTEGFAQGFVSRLYPTREALDDGAITLAEEIASKSPLGVTMAKQSIVRAMDRAIEEALLEDNLRLFPLYGSEDRKEASAAFLERRTPVWRGR
ncbi:MAG: enoyl-CoA hydratase/isomerase family protein [Dehalococcoidia bacterium]|nr:enoyl-CoA hydratase/isomerase family protein [Dehalococcoidia bacterium]